MKKFSGEYREMLQCLDRNRAARHLTIPELDAQDQLMTIVRRQFQVVNDGYVRRLTWPR